MIPDEAWLVEAWAPGHVTGFFTIEDEAEEPERIGSTGAGFSVESGVTSRVTMTRRGFPGVDLTVNGELAEAETSRSAVEYVLGREPWNVRVEQQTDLPVGQGFGASAAGALSSALAVAAALGKGSEVAVWAAHAAEVVHRTGLGDVVGANVGGFEIRERAGIAPHGQLRSFAADQEGREVALVVLDAVVPTSRVLRDPERRQRIQDAGRRARQALLASPDLPTFCVESDRFARDAGLRPQGVQRFLDTLDADVPAGQCMLGGSAFVFAEREETNLPESTAATRWTRVAKSGAHIVAAPERLDAA